MVGLFLRYALTGRRMNTFQPITFLDCFFVILLLVKGCTLSNQSYGWIVPLLCSYWSRDEHLLANHMVGLFLHYALIGQRINTFQLIIQSECFYAMILLVNRHFLTIHMVRLFLQYALIGQRINTFQLIICLDCFFTMLLLFKDDHFLAGQSYGQIIPSLCLVGFFLCYALIGQRMNTFQPIIWLNGSNAMLLLVKRDNVQPIIWLDCSFTMLLLV